MELELVDKSAYDEPPKQNTSTKEPYDGPERRVDQRRSGHDRRSMVRFELGKADRRQLEDRRSHGEIWDKAHTLF